MFFIDIGSFSHLSVKTVGDRQRHTVIITSTSDELFNSVNIMTLNALELPKYGVLVFYNFFAIFGCDGHFESELH